MDWIAIDEQCWGHELFDASKGLHVTTQAPWGHSHRCQVSPAAPSSPSISGVNHGVKTPSSPRKGVNKTFHMV